MSNPCRLRCWPPAACRSRRWRRPRRLSRRRRLTARRLPDCTRRHCSALPARRQRPRSPASLDDRIQDAKADVIRLNRDLLVLEEELLFPANTQVALFVSMDVGKMFSLDSVQVKLDDKVVANYLYTPLEVQALHRGGVQRLYVGNLKAGTHETRRLLHRQGTARARLQARRDDQVREGHRSEVHRAADQGLHRQAAAGIRRQGLAVGGGCAA